jgi:hypothetical protein
MWLVFGIGTVMASCKEEVIHACLPSAPIADAKQNSRQSECRTEEHDAACPDADQ